MQQLIESVLQDPRLQKLPHLRNGLLLHTLKGKYPNADILKLMDGSCEDATTKFGNYEDYYQYRHMDDRINQLKEYLENKRILDIGCHEGRVCRDLYKMKKSYVGVDIDRRLVNKAINRLVKLVIEDVYQLPSEVTHYLSNTEKQRLLATHHIQFHKLDVAKYTIHEEFDVILCLSVLKWIHLEGGDKGLQAFLRKCYEMTTDLFILEAYDSDSYWKKLHPEYYETFLNLQMIPEDIPNYLLEQVGFKSMKLITLENQVGGFKNRSLYVFYKY